MAAVGSDLTAIGSVAGYKNATSHLAPDGQESVLRGSPLSCLCSFLSDRSAADTGLAGTEEALAGLTVFGASLAVRATRDALAIRLL